MVQAVMKMSSNDDIPLQRMGHKIYTEMGNGASNSPTSKGPTQESRLQAKIRSAARFTSVRKTSRSRSETAKQLREFVNSQHQDANTAWEEFQDELTRKGGYRKRSSVKPEDEDITVDLSEPDEVNHTCPLCQQMALYESYVCRVCGDTYHKDCLHGKTIHDDVTMAKIETVYRDLGWSCPDCDNTFLLLSPDEFDEITEKFDELDTNKDASISLDEYMTYKCSSFAQLEGRPMSKFEAQFEALQFRRFDEDGNGTIDYNEFLKSEACKYLMRRPVAELVSLLKPRELRAARKMFLLADEDDGSSITLAEAQTLYYGWYRSLEKAIGVEGGQLAERRVQMLMEGDQDGDRSVSWREYLESQALYIIGSRPNGANFQGSYAPGMS